MRTFGASLLLRRRPGKEPPMAVLERVLEEWHARRAAMPSSAAIGLRRRVDSEARTPQTLRRFEFVQSSSDDGTWSTLVRALEDSRHLDEIAVTIEMDLEDVADRLAPLKIVVRPPGFLRTLSRDCAVHTIDGLEAPKGVLYVVDSGEVQLLTAEIFSPTRKLPLVVVTDPVYEAPLVEELPRKLGEYLFALGRVVYVSPSMTYAFTDEVGKELSVFDGGVRIYWPGAGASDWGTRHPLYLRRTQASWASSPEGIEKELLARIAQTLIRAAAPRFRTPPAMQEFERRVERERIEASSGTVQELKETLASRERALAEAQEIEKLALSENQDLRATLQRIEEELRTARDELFRERSKSASLQEAFRARGEAAPPAGAPARAEPSTAEEAVERGRVDFAGWLVLPDDMVLETDLGANVYQVLAAMREACEAERAGAKRDRALFQDRLAKHLGKPGRYEPGPTGVYHSVEGRWLELRDRIHLRNTRPVETETVYFAPVGGERAARRYLIARIGRHA